jgi:hypothetical protein
MNIIKLDSGRERFEKIFHKLRSESTLLVTWQVLSDGKRNITESSLLDVQFEENLLQFIFLSEGDLDPSLPIYFYCEDDEVIFKTNIKEIEPTHVGMELPKEIHFLEEAEVKILKSQPSLSTYWGSRRSGIGKNVDDLGSDFVVVKSMSQRSSRDQDFLNQELNLPTLDEEDKIFADKRETPRARPKVDKWVKIRKAGTRGISLLKLYDLSQGGMSFICIGADDYPKGCEINVTGFDQFDLDDPLVGKVMSSRPIDDAQIEFKIGVKFNDGQN